MAKITIATHDVLYNGNTLPAFARVYCNQQFVNDSGQTVPQGEPDGPNYIKQVAVTNSSGIATIDSFSGINRIDSSVDVNGATISTYALSLHAANGSLLTILYPSLRIPSIPTSTSWDDLVLFNQAAPQPPRKEYYDTLQTNRLLAELGAGEGVQTLANTYGNDLDLAIATIGGTSKTLIIDEDTELDTSVAVPSTLRLHFTNGAQITTVGLGAIVFEGIGLVDPESRIPFFSGFDEGSIVFSGTSFPYVLSANLWDDVSVSVRTNKAIAALSGKQAIVRAYPGNLTSKITVTEGLSLHLTRGTYTNSQTGANNYTIILQSNTRLYGDGQGQTFLEENADSARMVYGSGVELPPFNGSNENIEVCDITFQGHPDCATDSSVSAVFLGNVTNGWIWRNTFNETHGFAAYVGGFANIEQSRNVWIVDNLAIGLQTQNFGTVGGFNVHIERNTSIVKASSSSIAVIDVEPNAATPGTDGLFIKDNIIDCRLAQTATNGITIQQQYGSHLRNVHVSGNQVIGMNNTVVGFISTDVNVATNAIKAYSHGYETGQAVVVTADDGGLGNPLPGGLGASPAFLWIINSDIDNVQLATSYDNALVGIAIDITSQGGAGVLYLLTPFRNLSNGIQMFNTESSIVENNMVIGATQWAYDMQGCYRTTIRDNIAYGSGDGMQMIQDVECDIIDNRFYTSPQSVSQGSSITETDPVSTISTVNGSQIAPVVTDRVLPWWFRGLPVTISSVDYTIYQRIGANLILVPTPSVTGTDAGARVKGSSNRYVGNHAFAINLSPHGSSVVYSTADDLRKKGTVTINPASINANTVSTQTFTLTGATVADSLVLNPPTAGLTAGLLVLQAWVSAANTISVTFLNTTVGAIDEASATWYYTLFR